ncbi:Leucine-rich repeat-containing protein 15-like protein [Leptotrombidium deliense]|uniref:Leucine-rich repeat-containing protein 15-like protein n=1 Tax=Leptotrombidium deliense TaxID=299467 RepID=A0A443SRH4_9ACAR|nr:Leucine-rich repeat-containing protein 15-like protein [Leptotrombidium deliense]
MLLKFYILLSFVFVNAFAQTDEEICPKKEDIAPCSCDREGFSCLNAKSEDDIKRAFRAPVKQKATRGFWINGTPIKKISADTFNGFKIEGFHMEYNQIEEIENGAFSGSERTMRTLSADNNRIKSFNFKDLQKFSSLATVTFQKNNLQTIARYSFNNTNVKVINLVSNDISTVESFAFWGAKELRAVDLTFNDIEELAANSFSLSASGVMIGLTFNKIKKIDKKAFEGLNTINLDLRFNELTELDKDIFVPLILTAINHARKNKQPFVLQILTTGNPMSCTGCNAYRWLVEDAHLYSNIFTDFKCKDGRRLHELTLHSIGC